ncbi:MAG TPA: LuxR C-terminal-related transcriptional regulator [Bryobacteraceae bacterium]|jgi:DNA-binding CsgD family transcriptional regulator|nr:LuxR C-terminal-related transcriptional regulator [Bryobacteraceae bacterium]
MTATLPLAGSGLSGRERQLVREIASGAKNKDIAERMHLTVGTVKVYVSRLFGKLGLANRGELVTWGRRHALDLAAMDPKLTLGLKAGQQGFHNGRPVELIQLVQRELPQEVWLVQPLFVEGPRSEETFHAGDRMTPIHSGRV